MAAEILKYIDFDIEMGYVDHAVQITITSNVIDVDYDQYVKLNWRGRLFYIFNGTYLSRCPGDKRYNTIGVPSIYGAPEVKTIYRFNNYRDAEYIFHKLKENLHTDALRGFSANYRYPMPEYY